MNVAIVKAGGVGSRLGSKIPKQFITINDKPLLVYTLENIQKSTCIDCVIVPTLSDWIPVVESYVSEYGLHKVKHIIPGGNSNLGSLCKCYGAIGKLNLSNDDVIVMQDGNRPLITEKILQDLVLTAKKYGNAFACMPTTSFVMISDDDGHTASSYIDRSTVYMPQSDALSFKLFMDLWEFFDTNSGNAVSINDVMINCGIKLHIIPGDNKNFKVTTREDLDLLRMLINAEKNNAA